MVVDRMPPSIAEDLMGAGGAFCVQQGEQVDPTLLGGDHVFIVTTGIASKFQRSIDGRISGVGMVGCEGLFPLSAILSVPANPHIVVAHVADLGGRLLRAKDFQAIVARSDRARSLLNRYVYAFVGQITSNLLATERDPICTRIARLLLMCHDRVPDEEIRVTHDALAQMTFAHRPTVTNALHDLRDEGVIDIGRGCVRVRDRARLEASANGSYGMSESYWNEHIGPFGKGAQPDSLANVA